MQKSVWLILFIASTLILTGCASTAKPKRVHNACELLAEKPAWKKPLRRAAKKWKVQPSVMLAIMYQESAFKARAKPPRKRFLGIPTRRPSSAYGFAQAIDSTWKLYKRDANNWFAKRNKFADAIDFVGWYINQTRARLKIPADDVYRNYLAYHEGWGGYAKRSYEGKRWLKSVAKRVANQADRYRAQLTLCALG